MEKKPSRKVNIFDADTKLHVKMRDDSIVKYIPDFLTKEEGDELYEHLKKQDFWVQGIYKIFGKPYKTPRLLCASA